MVVVIDNRRKVPGTASRSGKKDRAKKTESKYWTSSDGRTIWSNKDDSNECLDFDVDGSTSTNIQKTSNTIQQLTTTAPASTTSPLGLNAVATDNSSPNNASVINQDMDKSLDSLYKTPEASKSLERLSDTSNNSINFGTIQRLEQQIEFLREQLEHRDSELKIIRTEKGHGSKINTTPLPNNRSIANTCDVKGIADDSAMIRYPPPPDHPPSSSSKVLDVVYVGISASSSVGKERTKIGGSVNIDVDLIALDSCEFIDSRSTSPLYLTTNELYRQREDELNNLQNELSKGKELVKEYESKLDAINDKLKLVIDTNELAVSELNSEKEKQSIEKDTEIERLNNVIANLEDIKQKQARSLQELQQNVSDASENHLREVQKSLESYQEEVLKRDSEIQKLRTELKNHEIRIYQETQKQKVQYAYKIKQLEDKHCSDIEIKSVEMTALQQRLKDVVAENNKLKMLTDSLCCSADKQRQVEGGHRMDIVQLKQKHAAEIKDFQDKLDDLKKAKDIEQRRRIEGGHISSTHVAELQQLVQTLKDEQQTSRLHSNGKCIDGTDHLFLQSQLEASRSAHEACLDRIEQLERRIERRDHTIQKLKLIGDTSGLSSNYGAGQLFMNNAMGSPPDMDRVSTAKSYNNNSRKRKLQTLGFDSIYQAPRGMKLRKAPPVVIPIPGSLPFLSSSADRSTVSTVLSGKKNA